jgi:tRNA 2-selenouridine synthase
MSLWNDPFLQRIVSKKIPLIDVRAPIEFDLGSIPHSVNLPIMNNEERALVGTCYKEQGQEKAIELGHKLVSGSLKEERVRLWKEYILKHPEAELFCFRGGLRSQTSCQWLKEVGVEKKPVNGGYKRLRGFFLSWLDEAPLPSLIRLGGPTGSGKSQVLQKFQNIDLENLAHHRGSAFGDQGIQPSQITFENNLALKLYESFNKTILIEDESAMIGKVSIPRRLFSHLRHAPLVILKVDKEKRVGNIYHQYVQGAQKDFFLMSLSRIQKRLGGVRFKEIQDEMIKSFEKGNSFEGHIKWITMLLDWYYDPFYAQDLLRQPGEILFEGDENEITEYLKASVKILKPSVF